jgi:hypothetical protein
MRSHRFLAGSAGALAAACMAACLATSAQAAPKVPQGSSFEFDLVVGSPLGSACPFPVHVSGTSAQKTHDTNGVVVATGPFVATFTNLDNGTSLTYNISGPTLADRVSGDTVYVGDTLILQPSSLHPGDTFIKYIHGRVEMTAENTIGHVSGKVVDVCAALS